MDKKDLFYIDKYHAINPALVKMHEPTYMEIGNYTGDSFRTMMNTFNARCIVYEASPAGIDALKAQTFPGSLTLHMKAVTGFNSPASLNVYEEKSSNSIIKRPDKESIGQIQVPGCSLHQCFRDNNLEKLDILVSNCEGGEKGFGPQIICLDIKQVFISFHPALYGDAVMTSLRKMLTSKYKNELAIEPRFNSFLYF